MSENKKIACVVLDGHVVDDGKKAHEPGETVWLTASDVSRLVKGGIVCRGEGGVGAKGRSPVQQNGSGKQSGAGTPDPEVDAALKAVADGNTTRGGLPKAEAMTEILGKPVTAAERDAIWQRAEARA